MFERDYIRDSKGDSLDISWLKDDSAVNSEDLPEPIALISQAKDELQNALAGLERLMKAL